MLKSEYPTFVPEALASALITVGMLTVEELVLIFLYATKLIFHLPAVVVSELLYLPP